MLPNSRMARVSGPHHEGDELDEHHGIAPCASGMPGGKNSLKKPRPLRTKPTTMTVAKVITARVAVTASCAVTDEAAGRQADEIQDGDEQEQGEDERQEGAAAVADDRRRSECRRPCRRASRPGPACGPARPAGARRPGRRALIRTGRDQHEQHRIGDRQVERAQARDVNRRASRTTLWTRNWFIGSMAAIGLFKSSPLNISRLHHRPAPAPPDPFRFAIRALIRDAVRTAE